MSYVPPFDCDSSCSMNSSDESLGHRNACFALVFLLLDFKAN